LFNDVGGIRVNQKLLKNERILDKSFSLTPLGLLLAACGGGGGGTATSSSTTNTTSNQTTLSYSGAVVKGPLSNSLVFLDYNKDGKLSSGEPTARTDINGNFSLTGNNGSADIVAIADSFTTDQSTGEKLSGVTLKAPNGSKVVSPTTTLMQDTGLSKSEVLSALGLPSNIDPTTFNPYAAGVNASQALLYEKVSHQIVNTVKGVSSALETSGLSESEAFDEALDAVSDVIKDKSLGGGTLNFTSEADISDVIAKVDPSNASVKTKFAIIKSTVSKAIDNTNEKIADVSDLTSSETKNTFGLSNDLTDQIKSAGSDTSKITFSDKSAVEDQLSNKSSTTETKTTVKTTTPRLVDSAAPTLDTAALSSRTYEVGETVTINYTSTDATGVARATFAYKDSGNNVHYVKGYVEDGQATLTIADHFMSGDYTLWYVNIQDTSGLRNEAVYNSNGTVSYDAAQTTHAINFANLNFTVENVEVDSAAPTLDTAALSSRTYEVGETVTINYTSTDATGVARATFAYKDSGNNVHYVKGYVEDGQATLTIADHFMSGDYTLWYVNIQDTSGLRNEAVYNSNGTVSYDAAQTTHAINFAHLNFEVGQKNLDLNGLSVSDTTLSHGDDLILAYDIDAFNSATRINTTWFKEGTSPTNDTALVMRGAINDAHTLSKIVNDSLTEGRYFLGQFQFMDDNANNRTEHFTSAYDYGGALTTSQPSVTSTHDLDFGQVYFDFII
jgi:predicted secreted protein